MALILGVICLAPVAAIAVSIPHMEEINGVHTYEVYKDNAEDFKVVFQKTSIGKLRIIEDFNHDNESS